MDCFQITLLLVYRILNSNNIQWNSIAEWLDVPMCDVILHPSPCKEKQLLVVGIETNFLTIWWGDEVHNLIRIISSTLTQYCTIDCQAGYLSTLQILLFIVLFLFIINTRGAQPKPTTKEANSPYKGDGFVVKWRLFNQKIFYLSIGSKCLNI